MATHFSPVELSDPFDRGPWRLKPRSKGKQGFLVLSAAHVVVARVPGTEPTARLVASALEMREAHIRTLANAAYRDRKDGETAEAWANRLAQKLERIERTASASVELSGGL